MIKIINNRTYKINTYSVKQNISYCDIYCVHAFKYFKYSTHKNYKKTKRNLDIYDDDNTNSNN